MELNLASKSSMLETFGQYISDSIKKSTEENKSDLLNKTKSIQNSLSSNYYDTNGIDVAIISKEAYKK